MGHRLKRLLATHALAFLYTRSRIRALGPHFFCGFKTWDAPKFTAEMSSDSLSSLFLPAFGHHKTLSSENKKSHASASSPEEYTFVAFGFFQVVKGLHALCNNFYYKLFSMSTKSWLLQVRVFHPIISVDIGPVL